MYTYTRISIRQSAKTQLKQWRTKTKLATLRVSDSFLGKDAQETCEDSVRMHNASRTQKPFQTCRTRRYVTTRYVLAFTIPPGTRLPRATGSRPNSGDFANLHQLHMHIRNAPCTQLDHSTALEALAAGSCTQKTQTHTRIEKGVRNKTPKKISVLHSHQQIAGHTRTRTRTRTRTHAHALTHKHTHTTDIDTDTDTQPMIHTDTDNILKKLQVFRIQTSELRHTVHIRRHPRGRRSYPPSSTAKATPTTTRTTDPTAISAAATGAIRRWGATLEAPVETPTQQTHTQANGANL